jgi:hypothetical protein
MQTISVITEHTVDSFYDFSKIDNTHLRILSELYKINLVKLQETTSEKLFKLILAEAINFNPNNSKKKKKRKKHILTTKPKCNISVENLKEPDPTFLEKLLDRIKGRKYLINDLLFNINIMLRFNKFHYAYFFDFRGRIYPQGTFTYLSPIVRNFISFAYDEKYSFNNFNRTYSENQIKMSINLIKEQIYSNLEDDSVKTREIINNFISLDKLPPISDLFTLNYKLSSIFKIRKLISDLINIRLDTPNESFRSFYTLDCSSSGTQLSGVLLCNLKIAEACSITRTQTNQETGDMYSTISSHTTYEMKNNILNVYQIMINKYPTLEVDSYALLLERKEVKKTLLNLYDKFYNKMNLLTNESLFDTITIRNIFASDLTFIFNEDEKNLLNHFINEEFAYFFKNPSTKKFKLMQINETLITCQSITRKYSGENTNTDAADAAFSEIFGILYQQLTVDYLHSTVTENEFILLIQRYCQFEIILSISKLKDIKISFEKYGVSKKLIKNNIMIGNYGATLLTKQTKIIDAIHEIAYKEGYLLTNQLSKEITNYAYFLTRVINRTIESLYPEITKLISIVKEECSKKTFNIFKIDSHDIIYEFKPFYVTSTVKKKLVNKSCRTHHRTSEIDYEKLANSFVANYIQHHDALLVMHFDRNLKENCNQANIKEIPNYTVHDCYALHTYYCLLLHPTLVNSYKDLYQHNKFEEHFKDYPEILNLRLKPDHPLFLKIDDINHPLIVKP